jgi:hypothetical protein
MNSGRRHLGGRLERLLHRIQAAADPNAELADGLGLDVAQPLADLVGGQLKGVSGP